MSIIDPKVIADAFVKEGMKSYIEGQKTALRLARKYADTFRGVDGEKAINAFAEMVEAVIAEHEAKP
jgi:hypothetical protein